MKSSIQQRVMQTFIRCDTEQGQLKAQCLMLWFFIVCWIYWPNNLTGARTTAVLYRLSEGLNKLKQNDYSKLWLLAFINGTHQYLQWWKRVFGHLSKICILMSQDIRVWYMKTNPVAFSIDITCSITMKLVMKQGPSWPMQMCCKGPTN